MKHKQSPWHNKHYDNKVQNYQTACLSKVYCNQ